jgi:NAD(P)-dependent dehydrogenase (short-subunit alcohol dehydrogenase family)
VELTLAGAVAIVTGAGRGLGRATAERLLAEEANVAALDVAWDEPLLDVMRITTDVTNDDAVAAAVAKVVSAHGRVDLLVNCAGVIGPLGPLPSIAVPEWRRTLDVNLTGTFLACRAVLPTMLAQRAGSIINFASGAAVDHPAGQAPYNASKAGVISLTKTISREIHLAGVRINAVCPANVDTQFQDEFLAHDLSENGLAIGANQVQYRDLRDKGLIWRPEEVLDLVVFLASPAGSHINGQFIRMSAKSEPQVYH